MESAFVLVQANPQLFDGDFYAHVLSLALKCQARKHQNASANFYSDGDPPSTNSSRNADKHSPDTNIQAISDSVEDSNCRRAAQRLEIHPSTSEIDNLKAQVYELEHSHYIGAVTGSTTANSQRMEQEDRIRAASLRATIATKEQQNSSIHLESQSAARAALAKCDTEKADRDKARENLSE